MRARRLVLAAVGAVGLSLLPHAAPAARESSPAAVAAGQAIGSWSVQRIARDTYRVTWRSPHRLPVAGDRPVIERAGRALGHARVGRDGRSVSVVVRSQGRPAVSALHVRLSGDRVDVAGDDRRRQSAGPEAPFAGPATRELAVDPGTPGPFPVASSDYELAPVKLPGMPEPIEMVGHVVEPETTADTGPRPLVLFLHGRHSYCYDPSRSRDGWQWPCVAPYEEVPSHLGYDYVQRVLASQGFATVSVRVNGINAQDFALDDGGADARAAIVERHLEHWVGLALEHRVDLSRVVLVGHSRGGDGVARAAIETPLAAPYRIAGQVLLAPTDFGVQTAAYVPTVTVLPYCDGDVFDLQGQAFTDSARDLAADDTSLKSSVLVMGANHNFFNTEWTPGLAQAPAWDDWGDDGPGLCGTAHPDRLTAAEQRSVGVAYVAGAAQLFAGGDQQLLPMYDGSATHVPSTGDAVVLSHAIGGGRDVRRPGIDAGRSLPDGADSQLCQGVFTWRSRTPSRYCGRFGELAGNTPHWVESGSFVPRRKNLEVAWTAPGQSAGLALDEPLDLSADRRLELRVIVDPVVGDVALRVRLRDADGATVEVDPVGGQQLAALPSSGWLGKRWAQSVLVDPATAAGVDLTRIVGVDLVGVSAAGRVWVLDAAAAPSRLPRVPDRRLPVVSFGKAVVQEGDASAASARVPFTITGDLTERASLRVGAVSYDTRERRTTLSVDLAPGQTSGAVVVDYQGNRIDDLRRRLHLLVGYARFGVMTDDYVGRLVVRDDDPTPRLRVTAPRMVREGQRLTVSVRLSDRVGYRAFGWIRAVRTSGRQLSVGDVPRAWLVKREVPRRTPASTSLAQARLVDGLWIKDGSRTATFSMPIRADRVREGRERVALQVRVFLGGKTRTVTRTVTVRD